MEEARYAANLPRDDDEPTVAQLTEVHPSLVVQLVFDELAQVLAAVTPKIVVEAIADGAACPGRKIDHARSIAAAKTTRVRAVSSTEMRPVPFYYSVDYNELFSVVTAEFDEWLEYELSHGGVNDVRVDCKVSALIDHYAPSSPRQLLELAMQCEELLGAAAEDGGYVGYEGDDAYEALVVAVSQALRGRMWQLWEHKKREEAVALAVRSLGAEDGAGAAEPPPDAHSD